MADHTVVCKQEVDYKVPGKQQVDYMVPGKQQVDYKAFGKLGLGYMALCKQEALVDMVFDSDSRPFDSLSPVEDYCRQHSLLF